MLTRSICLLNGLLLACATFGQGGDAQLRSKADALFGQEKFAEAMPMYSQLVSLEPSDRQLNYHFGTCLLFSGDDHEKSIGFLKYSVEDPGIPALAWYYLGRAYHLNYRFADALNAYQRFRGTGDKKAIADHPVDALEKQARNGQLLLNNLKDVTVHNKVEVDANEFFRYYDLEGIGGRIVVTPEELLSSYDKKSGERFLVYLPEEPGPFFFSSYGKDGRTGRDIYRAERMPNGTFSAPIRLAGFINTDQDEDFPVLQPDGKTFYFASKGHSSMGGYDVFKSTFDKGMDVFGPPENLDFAVNTPDDDLFYLVDAAGEQACFASGRSSRQDMLHVYRISTRQVPLTLTVLKGTFASEFNADDRKAKITVEDGLTREVITTVSTDINGSYILSLPRSGRYRFLVEAGPSGRMHAGIVEVPASDVPRAYRQELTLVDQSGQERLIIKNYFDDPLDEDMIALALAEIKRRARLDIGEAREVVAQEPEQEVAPMDLIGQAGFSGDMTKQGAVELSRAFEQEDRQRMNELEERTGEAYTVALRSVQEADTHGKRAGELLTQAEAAGSEETRNELTKDAARERTLAKQANLRARAAIEAGEELELKRMASAASAQRSGVLATELAAAVSASNDQETLVKLTALKAEQDARSGPEREIPVSEQMRRAASEADREVEKRMASANAQRTEHTELLDRIARLKTERDATRNKSRSAELDRQITEYTQQAQYLDDEVNAAFRKADQAETEARIAQAKADLVANLEQGAAGNIAATEMDLAAVNALKSRVAGNDERVAELVIDQRFEAELAAEERRLEAETFDWELALAEDGAPTARTGTRSASGSPVEAMQGRETTMAYQDPEHATQDATQADATTVTDGPGTERSVGGNAGAPAGGDVLLATAAAGVPVPDDRTGSDRSPIEPNTTADAPTVVVPGGLTPEQIREQEEEQRTIGPEPAELTREQQLFVLENRLAELKQLQNATKDKEEKAAIQERIDRLSEDIAKLNTKPEPGAEPVAIVEEVQQVGSDDMAASASVETADLLSFDPDMPEEELQELIRQGHTSDMARAATIADLDQRNAVIT
ncbi:MAG: PD40 domain-containing protein, partial [Flavobacteriales bacterium]|nr:PD40 domain-containing protein [Flavobacteriales bacterium]